MLQSSINTHSNAFQPASRAGSVFFDKPHAELYWKALVHAANKKHESAKAIVAAIQANTPEVAHAHMDNNCHPLDACFNDIFVSLNSSNPQGLTELGLFESIGIREHNAYLNDVSPQRMLQHLETKKACLQMLENTKWENLSPEQQNSLSILLWQLKHNLAGEQFLFHEYQVTQMVGVLFDLSVLLTAFHKIETVRDAEHYIARLEKIPAFIDQTIALLEYQKSLNIVVPAFSIDKVVNIIQSLLPTAVTEQVFYTTLENKIQTIQTEQTDILLAQALQVIQTAVYPAFVKLQDYLKQLRTHVATNHGVWALPNGDAFYDYILEHHTTTHLTADQIHELGLKEVASIQKQMREILASIGIVDDSKPVGALVQEIAQDPSFYFPDTAEGREQCLAEFRTILERCRKELYPLFDIKPNSLVAIQPIPKHEEEGMPGAYYFGPSLDGSRPGTFFANLRSMKEVPKYGMETLAIHEAEPGHHFQVTLQVESNLPVIRRVMRPDEYNAYVEGWALYAEKLAYEHNFYSSPYAKLGHLRDELLRAVRLVVDTGIHRKRWTREQAIDYMEQATGFHRNSVTTEVERYFVLPGQACSYKIGQLKILELRQRAKDVLGNKFDIRHFHNVVLNLGAAPLTILEDVVNQYIKDNATP